MRYRVHELAAQAGVSVDTVRFYQARGLLPQPQREGRLAWYDAEHLDRLHRIRDLKDRGFTLGSIHTLLSGDLDEADGALAEAVLSGVDAPTLTIEDVAARTGVSVALLQAIEREGLLVAQEVDGHPRYTPGDAKVVAAGLGLLEAGLPLSELLALARRHDEAMREIARQAVEMFLRFVRDPIRARHGSEEDAAASLVGAFKQMLPATTSLVAHHFERVLLQESRARIAEEGSPSEIAAVEGELGA